MRTVLFYSKFYKNLSFPLFLWIVGQYYILKSRRSQRSILTPVVRSLIKSDHWMNLMEPLAAETPYMTSVGNHEFHYNFTHYNSRYASQSPDGNPFFYRYHKIKKKLLKQSWLRGWIFSGSPSIPTFLILSVIEKSRKYRDLDRNLKVPNKSRLHNPNNPKSRNRGWDLKIPRNLKKKHGIGMEIWESPKIPKIQKFCGFGCFPNISIPEAVAPKS